MTPFVGKWAVEGTPRVKAPDTRWKRALAGYDRGTSKRETPMTQVCQKARVVANDQAPHDGADVVPIAAEDREVTNPPESRAPATQRYLLVLQFAVFNLAAFALLGAAGVQGWLATTSAPTRLIST